MSNYNKNDDFFESEYGKIASNGTNGSVNNVDVNGWYNYTSPNKVPQNGKRNIFIIVTSILLVLAFVGGFLFASMLKPISTEGLLNEVIQTIQNDLLYGEDLTEQDRINMIEQAGTAMLQAVDKYGMLLSPQTAYNLFNPVANEMSGNDRGYFGFGYQYSSLGLYVSTVYADSNSYGKLQEGDLIVRFDEGYSAWGTRYEFNVADVSQEECTTMMSSMVSCTLSVLRNGTIVKIDLQRAKVGNGNNEFVMIEYYFGSSNTNMSTTPQNGAAVSSVKGRGLDKLPNNVGYIRLAEFDHYQVNGKSVTAESEFKKALDKFKQSGKTKLIVDLKGNPGGYVTSAANIIGMLASSPNVEPGSSLLACTLVDKNNDVEFYYSQAGYNLYDYYFGAQNGNTKDIVIWTDGNSASASELTTGALLDYGTAIQMGITTYGKGIAQVGKALPYTGEIINNNGQKDVYNWYVYYTTARYYSPNGTNIHGVGYTPTEQFNGLKTYTQLVNAVIGYWG